MIGFTGPGGAGKTTLIDELVLRFLQRDRKARIAVLSHDPSVIGEGALLGDRATMINSQDDRVFMRSMATRGKPVDCRRRPKAVSRGWLNPVSTTSSSKPSDRTGSVAVSQ